MCTLLSGSAIVYASGSVREKKKYRKPQDSWSRAIWCKCMVTYILGSHINTDQWWKNMLYIGGMGACISTLEPIAAVEGSLMPRQLST